MPSPFVKGNKIGPRWKKGQSGNPKGRPTKMELLLRGLPGIPKLAKRVSEGVSAEKTVFANFKGEITDQRNCVDFEQRRQYTELALNLHGIPVTQKHEHSGTDGEPIQVEIRRVGSKSA